MSGRRVNLPKGAKIDEHGRLVMPDKKPRDASQAKSWAKGGKKGKRRVVTKAATAKFNAIGRLR